MSWIPTILSIITIVISIVPEATLSRFFISPKLHIEYEETPETANIFCPAQTYLTPDGTSFTRRYLRVRVKNSGYISATNCEAKIRISNRDVKQLVWDGARILYRLRRSFTQKRYSSTKRGGTSPCRFLRL